MLNLPEQLFLLAVQQGKANVLNSSLRFGLVGAVLSELLIEGKVERRGDLLLPNSTPALHPLLNGALAIMLSADRGRKPKYWVNRLNCHLRRLTPCLTGGLVAKSVLTIEHHKALGLFPYKSYKLSDPHVVTAVIDDLRRVISQSLPPTPRQVALIGLIKPAGLKLFSRAELAAAKQRIAEIAGRDPISKAVTDAINDVAVSVAIIAATG